VLEHRREGAEREESGTVVGAFLTCSHARHRGKEGGRGSGGGRRVQGGNGKERGCPSTAGDGLGGWHRPPAGGRGRRRCRATVEGSGGASDMSAAADKWGPVGSS
jgi:hypothetical protein